MARRREDGRWEVRIIIGHKEDGASIFRYVFARRQNESGDRTAPGRKVNTAKMKKAAS